MLAISNPFSFWVAIIVALLVWGCTEAAAKVHVSRQITMKTRINALAGSKLSINIERAEEIPVRYRDPMYIGLYKKRPWFLADKPIVEFRITSMRQLAETYALQLPSDLKEGKYEVKIVFRRPYWFRIRKTLAKTDPIHIKKVGELIRGKSQYAGLISDVQFTATGIHIYFVDQSKKEEFKEHLEASIYDAKSGKQFARFTDLSRFTRSFTSSSITIPTDDADFTSKSVTGIYVEVSVKSTDGKKPGKLIYRSNHLQHLSQETTSKYETIFKKCRNVVNGGFWEECSRLFKLTPKRGE